MENCFVLLSILLCGFIASSIAAHSDNNFRVGRNQISYYTEELSEERFLEFSRLSNTTHLRETLRHILVPRIVGTESHRQVRDYIIKSLQDSEWSVELHKFHDTVPIFDKLHFHNIIAKLNPNAERYLVMACHYDSKYMPDFEFIGATDSAVPCAMLLNMAHLMQAHLQPFRDSALSLMFIFFDGEEAFKEWGPQDSIYGARRLAEKWDADGFIDRIDLMILLDLIGAPDPKFYSFFKNTESWYSRLIEIEDRLSGAGLLERYISSGIAHQDPNRYFQLKSLRSSQVEDDHIPFLRRDVPVLHLIPLPFPTVWHTKEDNEAVIDYATTENIGRIVRLFVMEYLYGGVDREWTLENFHGNL